MSTGTKLGSGFALGMVIIVAIAIHTQVLMQQLSEANRRVVHTHQVLEGLERLVSLLKDAETGQRGFLLTGEGRYLEPYTAASGRIPRQLDALFSLTGDNPAQQESLRRARKLADAKLAELDETIQLRRKSGPQAALQVVRSDRGQRIMDDLRAVMNEMETREQELLEARSDAVNVVSHRTLLTIALVMPLALVAIAVVVVALIRNLRFLGPDPRPATPGGKWPGIAITYISTAMLVAVAAVLRWLGESLGPLPLFITFYPAVLLAAILGGSGPGILATVLSALVAVYFFVPPVGQFQVEHPNDLLALGIFVGTNVSISVLAERLRRVRWAEAVSAAQEQELALLDLGNLLSLDPDHRIVHWSEGCHRLYGFDPQEAQGRLADELLQTHVPQPLERINRTLLEHGHWEGELTRRRKDGAEIVVEVLWALRRDAQGRPSAILEVSTDVTQRGRDAEAIRSLNVELARRGDLLQKLLDAARLGIGEEGTLRDISRPPWGWSGSRPPRCWCTRSRTEGSRYAQAGLGPNGSDVEPSAAENAFVERVIAEDRTTGLADASLLADLSLPHTPGAQRFQAVLASPMRIDGQASGAVVIYSRRKHEWTEAQFRLAEWLAGRCASILEALRLQDQLRRQAALIDLSPDAIIVRRLDGTITFWSRGAEAIYHWPKDQAIGQSTHRLLRTEFPEPLEQIVEHVKGTGQWSGELIHRTQDGREVVVQSRWLARLDAHGEVAELLESNVDITERKRAEEALRGSEERFRTMANAIPQLAWIAKPDGYIDWYNQRWYEYTGTTPEQMEGWGWQSVHDPQQLPEVLERWKRSIATGEPFDMVFPLRGSDGVFRPFLTRVMPLKDDQGRVHQWFGTNTDVSEQKQAEEALRESEERFRLLIEGVRDYAIFTLDPEGRVTSWNAGAERIKGYRAEEILGQPFTRFYPPEAVRGGLPSRLLQTAAAEGRCEDEGWRVRKDGGRFWADAIVTALRNEAGHLRGFVKITRDMTERKRTEARILRQTAVLDGINRIFRDALRCETEEDLGRTCLAVAEGVTASKFGFLGEINPTTGLLDDIAISDPGWEDCRIDPLSGNRRPPLHFQIHGIYGRVLRDGRGLFTNDPATHPDRIGVPPGHPPLTAFLGVPFVRDGQTIGMVAVGNRDGGYGQEELEALEALAPAMVEAFSRSRAEAALHRLNQELDQRVRARTLDLEAANKELEAFSYSVSHDLPAPLRGMDGFSQALLESYDGQLDARGRDWLNRIRAGCQRMGQLIDDLLRLSRLTRAEMRRQRVDLTAMAREIAGELRETAPGRPVEFRIAEGLTGVGDPHLLRPALRNLLENAWKFTAKRPAAVIELGRSPAPPPTDPAAAPDPARPHPGETTYFVRDNGAGFDMAYADKLFGPFQRLHSVKDYPGNGIGLALVQRVVHRHGGRIWAEAAPDQGATFYFTLNEPGGGYGA